MMITAMELVPQPILKMSNKLIAFTGQAKAGKTTAATILSHYYGHRIMRFADPLKEVTKIVFDLTEEQVNGEEKDIVDDVLGVTPRTILQKLGTELFQYKLHEVLPDLKIKRREVWCYSFEKRYEKNKMPVVIDDLRFLHEAKLIRELGGVIIKVIRPELHSYPSLTEIHKSEAESELIEADYTVYNDGSLTEFKEDIIKLYRIHIM